MNNSYRDRLIWFYVCIAGLLNACGSGGNPPNAAPSTYTVGGKLTGLAAAATVVLQNGGENITLSANAAFSFPTHVANGTAYAVTVMTQPTGQTCIVASGTGLVSGANVTSIRVTCVVNTYTISGTVSGLNAGTPVTLANKGANPTVVKANGAFTLAAPVNYGGSFSVAVAVQPPAQNCVATGGVGSDVTANVSGIVITCIAATESVVHSFDANADGISPMSTVVRGADGNFYGTTYSGGAGGLGTVFRITPSGVETVLHSFVGGATDGSFPAASLIQGSDGSFYGTTANGGPTGAGTVFKITSSGTETVIYFFTGGDGISPFGALIQGSDGNFYGTTSGGGPNLNGTVFRLTPSGAMTILHSFTGGITDGSNSTAALIEGADGNFYGTTLAGGPSYYGTVFKITPSGVETVLHFFSGGATDGSAPAAALIQAADGNFYGTTYQGGASDAGTVFKITPAGAETLLYSFAVNSTDGDLPAGALIQGNDGNFYGTASQGGVGGDGIVFKITPAGVESVIYAFLGTPADGTRPQSALFQAPDGNFYVTTSTGGKTNAGSLVKITPSGSETLIFSFNSGPEGQNPVGLIQGNDGNFYGTTNNGGTSNGGTAFVLTPDGVETVLHEFAGGSVDGSHPASLLQGSDGNLYGTTALGGANNFGTVFTMTRTGVETLLHSFTAGEGQCQTPLIQGNDGNFYGSTGNGGTGGGGLVFKITSSGTVTALYSFAAGTTDGNSPNALLLGSDGNFYGTTGSGGADGYGTVFRITPAGLETILYSFKGGTTDGRAPNVALIQGSDGNFYGTTYFGGVNDLGTAFKITPVGVETVLHSFAGGTTDGLGSFSSLIQGTDGNFYGTSAGGGTFGHGTLFRITPTGGETVLYSFEGGLDGSNPGGIAQGSDGIFYGITTNGGSSNLGTAFKY
jgi:uncharacterized repeat protein (TIGR03803 family)